MTAPDPETPDPGALAREALALCEKATPAPWTLSRDGQRITQTKHVTRDVWEIPHSDGDMPLIAHAGTHYATLATALLRAEARAGRLEALLREARCYCMGTDCTSKNVIERLDAALAQDRGEA